MLHGVKETSGCAPAPNGASASRDETTPKKLRLSREEGEDIIMVQFDFVIRVSEAC